MMLQGAKNARHERSGKAEYGKPMIAKYRYFTTQYLQLDRTNYKIAVRAEFKMCLLSAWHYFTKVVLSVHLAIDVGLCHVLQPLQYCVM